MNRSRRIAGTPVRSGFDSWAALVDVLTASLETSPNIPTGTVPPELARLDGLGPALAGGGHLDTTAIVLVADPLHVSFTIVTGGAAFDADDAGTIVPGSASAAADWRLYVPKVDPFTPALEAAAKGSGHLQIGNPPDVKKNERAASGGIDLDMIRRLAASS